MGRGLSMMLRGCALGFIAMLAAVASAGEDNFAEARVITGSEGSDSGTFEGAAVEEWESDLRLVVPIGSPSADRFLADGASIWWSWTPPSTGPYEMTLCSPAPSTLLTVSRGETLPGQESVTFGAYQTTECPGEDGARVAFMAWAESTYNVRAAIPNPSSAAARLSWRPIATPPANDLVTSPTMLSGRSGIVEQALAGSTRNGPEEAVSNSTGGAIWFQYEGIGSDKIRFSTCGTSFPHTFTVYNADSVGGWRNSAIGGLTAHCYTASQGYTGVVPDLGSALPRARFRIIPQAADAVGVVRLSWEVVPEGDDANAPILLSGPDLDTSFTTAGATALRNWEGYNVPRPEDAIGSINLRYSVPTDGVYSLDLTGTDYRSQLFVTPVESAYTPNGWRNSFEYEPGISPPARWPLTAGTDLAITVFSRRPHRWKDPTEGVAHLRISRGPDGVANDEPSGAIEWRGSGGTLSGHVLGATYNPGTEGILGNQFPGVWYRWTAPRDTTLRISERSQSAGVLGIYSIDEQGQPDVLLDDTSLSHLLWSRYPNIETSYNTKANTSYLIMLAHSQSERRTQAHDLEWTISEPNDLFHQARHIHGDSGIVPLRMENAGIEQGEVVSSYYIRPRSVWYLYRPSTRGFYDLSLSESGMISSEMSLRIYDVVDSGLTLSNSVLTEIDPYGIRGRDRVLRLDPVLLDPKRQYAIQVLDSEQATDSFLKHFQYALSIPAADDFAEAAELDGTSGSIFGALNWSTTEEKERVPYFNLDQLGGATPSGLGTLWYRFVAPESGRWAINVDDKPSYSKQYVLQVFKGDRLEDLTLLYSHSSRQGQYRKLPSAQLAKGDVVYAQVSSTNIGPETLKPFLGSYPDGFTMRWAPVTDPVAPNDNYIDAEEIYGPEGTLELASGTMTSEYYTSDWMFERLNSEELLWYKWMAPADGMLYVYSCAVPAHRPHISYLLVGDDVQSALPGLSPYGSVHQVQQLYVRSYCGQSQPTTVYGMRAQPVRTGTTYHFGVRRRETSSPGIGNFSWKFVPNSEAAYPSEWHFAEGASVDRLETFYAIANPHDEPIEVDMLIMPETGAHFSQTMTVGPKARSTERLGALLDSRGLTGGAGASFRERQGRGFGVERTVYAIHPEKQFFQGGHTAMGANETRREWVMPEGSLGTAGPDGTPFQTFILLANPSPDPVRVDLDFFPENAPGVRRSFLLPPWKRVTIEPKTSDGLPPWGFMSVARGDRPFVAERVTWWSEDGPNGRYFAEATASGPPPAAAPLSHLAPFHSSVSNWKRFFLIGNGEDQNVMSALSPGSGAPLWTERGIRAQQRLTTEDPGLFGDFYPERKVYFRSTAPLVLELAVYNPSADGRSFLTGGSRYPSSVASRRWMIPNIRNADEAGFRQRFKLEIMSFTEGNIAVEVRFHRLDGQFESYNAVVDWPPVDWKPIFDMLSGPAEQRVEILRSGWIEVFAPEPIILNYTSEVRHLRDDGTAELIGEFTGTAIPGAPLIPIELPMETAPASFQFTLGGEGEGQQMLLPTPTVTPTPVPMPLVSR